MSKKELVDEIIEECKNKNVSFNQEELENSSEAELLAIHQIMQAIKNATKKERQQIIQMMKNKWFPN